MEKISIKISLWICRILGLPKSVGLACSLTKKPPIKPFNNLFKRPRLRRNSLSDRGF